MKKLFSVLLLLLTMLGTFCPCCVQDECSDEVTQSETSAQHGHEEKGNCSPFFACGTCAAALEANTGNIVVADLASPFINHISVYLFQLRNYSPSFFQPPRLS